MDRTRISQLLVIFGDLNHPGGEIRLSKIRPSGEMQKVDEDQDGLAKYTPQKKAEIRKGQGSQVRALILSNPAPRRRDKGRQSEHHFDSATRVRVEAKTGRVQRKIVHPSCAVPCKYVSIPEHPSDASLFGMISTER